MDERQEKIGYKIREAQMQKIPYMLVVGDREAAEGTVGVRTAPAGIRGTATAQFIEAALGEVRSRQSAPPARRESPQPDGEPVLQ